MDQKARASERSEHYQGRILIMLQAWPLSAMEIAGRLNNEISITSTSMHLRALEKDGKVRKDHWERHPGRDTYAIWTLVEQPKKFVDRTLKIVKGVDIEDIEWMRFWRAPRTERRRVLWGE